MGCYENSQVSIALLYYYNFTLRLVTCYQSLNHDTTMILLWYFKGCVYYMLYLYYIFSHDRVTTSLCFYYACYSEVTPAVSGCDWDVTNSQNTAGRIGEKKQTNKKRKHVSYSLLRRNSKKFNFSISSIKAVYFHIGFVTRYWTVVKHLYPA